MIAPGNRLLFWTAVVSLACAVAYAAAPALWPLFLGIMGLFLLLSVLDAALTPGRLDGVHAAFDVTPVGFRLTKDREGRVALHLRNEAKRPRRIRLGIAFPPVFRNCEETRTLTLPAGAEAHTLNWPCTPTKRGLYRLENLYLEIGSPLGFWLFRTARPVQAELRVYPNLLSERNRLAAIFLNRGTLGIHARRRVGKGRDFEKLREYIPGDSYEDVHWKATARRARPITKIYQVERTQEVYVVMDASRLSARTLTDEGGSPATQLDRFIQAAMVLGMIAERQGDLFGLLTFSDRIHGFVRARTGRAHFNACRDALYTLEPRAVSPDFDELCTFIRTRLTRRALLVVLTNLDDPVLAESFTRNLDLINRRHLILVNMLTPRGAGPLFTGPEVSDPDEVYRRLGAHLQWRDLRELQRVLYRRGVTMGMLENASLTPELVSQYLNVKQRQLL